MKKLSLSNIHRWVKLAHTPAFNSQKKAGLKLLYSLNQLSGRENLAPTRKLEYFGELIIKLTILLIQCFHEY